MSALPRFPGDGLIDVACVQCGRNPIDPCRHDQPVCRLVCCRKEHGDHCRTCNGVGSLPRPDSYDTTTYGWGKPQCPDCRGTGKRTA